MGILIMNQTYKIAVRDRVPERIRSQGRDCEVQEYSDEGYLRHLEYRLLTEMEAYLESEEPERLADLLEVIYRVAELRGVLPDELDGLRQKMAAEKGGFSGNLVLLSAAGGLCSCEKSEGIFEDD